MIDAIEKEIINIDKWMFDIEITENKTPNQKRQWRILNGIIHRMRLEFERRIKEHNSALGQRVFHCNRTLVSSERMRYNIDKFYKRNKQRRLTNEQLHMSKLQDNTLVI